MENARLVHMLDDQKPLKGKVMHGQVTLAQGQSAGQLASRLASQPSRHPASQ